MEGRGGGGLTDSGRIAGRAGDGPLAGGPPTTDAGAKANTIHRPWPIVSGETGMSYTSGSDEFGTIRYGADASRTYRVGDRLGALKPGSGRRMVPGAGCRGAREAMQQSFEQRIPENPGRPGAKGRIASAVDLALKLFEPEQVILFGSGARGEMTERSDVDLLVVRPTPPGAKISASGLDAGASGCRDDGDGTVQMLVTDRERLEHGRWLAGDVRQYALEEGRTLHLRPGCLEIATGGPETTTGRSMAARARYDPERALEHLAQATVSLNAFDQMMRDGGYKGLEDNLTAGPACMLLQRCMELSLKALQLCHGRPPKTIHDLAKLADAAAEFEPEAVQGLDTNVLDELSKFAGSDAYDGQRMTDVPKAIRTAMAAEDPVRRVYGRAQRIVPGRTAETKEKFTAAGMDAG